MNNQKAETASMGVSEKLNENGATFLSIEGAPGNLKPYVAGATISTDLEFGPLKGIGGLGTSAPVQECEAPVGLPSSPKLLPRWKACLDAVCIFCLSPLLLPLMFLIALWIKLVSRGPAIFKQQRVGYLGMRFTILKFRTMEVGSHASTHRHHVQSLMRSEVPMTKMDCTGDPRLIPMGVWLRATGLDELPQLINVLRGEMSLVGPRPCTFYEFEHYLPWQKERFNVLPGLTGLWQVNGKNKTTFTQMINLDIRYARAVSLKLDLKIIVKTFAVLIRQFAEAIRVKWKRITADKVAGRARDEAVGLSQSANSGR